MYIGRIRIHFILTHKQFGLGFLIHNWGIGIHLAFAEIVIAWETQWPA